MRPVIINFNAAPAIGEKLVHELSAESAEYTYRHFPDGETYIRIDTTPGGRDVVIVSSLENPDSKILPLLFLASTSRELGAGSVGLVSPYLPYMRQDRRFGKGEAVTSRYFSDLISGYFDWLVTVDPHLHRYNNLNEIYTIPNRIVHAAPAISEWIREKTTRPFLIGPDIESKQWVSEVAGNAGCPYTILTKERTGDRQVAVSIPKMDKWTEHTPVIIDDIISTGHTMTETLKHLGRMAGLRKPVCIAVHGIFAEGAYQSIIDSGAERLVTCNTIEHNSNGIDLSDLIAAQTLGLLEQNPG